MRILQVCLKPPYPKLDGGCIAIAAMTESMLISNHDLKVICVSTHKHPFKAEKVPAEVLKRTKMEAVEVDTQLKPIDAIINLFSNKSYNIKRFYSQDFENRLVEILTTEEFDVVHLESIFCTPYVDVIRKHSKSKVVVRAHNIEFQIWQQLAENEKNPLKKWYLNLLSNRLKNYELSILNQVDAIVPITNSDKDELRKLGITTAMEVVPIGIKVAEITQANLSANNLHLYHLGAMDWAPNIEGVSWFLDEVWPKIEANYPSVLCSCAGRKMPASLLSRSSEKLHFQGEVASVSEFVSDKNVAVIPLLSGSGMRVKIVEALAFGKVVITTSIGATGIPYADGKNILIVNTPEEFVDKIKLLIDQPELLKSIGLEARKLAEAEFNLQNLSSKLTYFYANL